MLSTTLLELNCYSNWSNKCSLSLSELISVWKRIFCFFLKSIRYIPLKSILYFSVAVLYSCLNPITALFNFLLNYPDNSDIHNWTL